MSRPAKIQINCANCQKTMSLWPSRINRGSTNYFCCVDCRVEWQGKNSVMVTKPCEYCGKAFTSQPSNRRKFCSNECGGLGRRKNQAACEHCGKDYMAHTGTSFKYCSRDCQLAAIRNKNTRQCKQCGESFVWRGASAGLYCSNECRSKSMKGKKPHNYDQVEVRCQICDKPFLVGKYRIGLAKYCSYECSGKARQQRQDKTCPICGKHFEVWRNRKDTAVYCSRKCHMKYARGTNHPSWKSGVQRYYYGPNWKEQQGACRERDKHTCRHCGKKHKKGARLFDVHHIRPFRTFGYKRGENENYKEANELTNLITLCLPCHVRAEHGNVSFQLNLL